MELHEIMRLIWQAILNVPGDAPEREEAVRAYGALTSRLGYTPPELLLVPKPDGYTGVRFAREHEEIRLGERMTEVPLGRPFPKTYGDWVDLGISIKETDPGVAFMVNAALEDISGDTEHADVQKRWLTEKASELGIT